MFMHIHIFTIILYIVNDFYNFIIILSIIEKCSMEILNKFFHLLANKPNFLFYHIDLFVISLSNCFDRFSNCFDRKIW